MSTVRWGILGTAGIAVRSFLPAVRAAGHTAIAVGSRDCDKAAAWAKEHGVERAGSYADVLEADDIDAVYIPLPNDHHTEPALAAARAGKAVLCEKPLGLDATEVASFVDDLGAEGDSPGPLVWEAFVFPFHPQSHLVLDLCAPDNPDGIGPVHEIVSEFHYDLPVDEPNIRWRPEHGGGALLDIGCYSIRFARMVYAGEPESAVASVTRAETGVDAETAAIVDFEQRRRLLMSVSMLRPDSTFARVLGQRGELRMTNPFHPTVGDTVQVWRDGSLVRTVEADGKAAFQYAIEHIAAVVAGEEQPRHLAISDALGNARALDLVVAAGS